MKTTKKSLPSGVTEDSVLQAIKGTQKQAEKRLQQIIDLCKYYDTEEAEILRCTATDYLYDVTGECVKEAIENSILRNGKPSREVPFTKWFFKHILKIAKNVKKVSEDSALITGIKDGKKWAVLVKSPKAGPGVFKCKTKRITHVYITYPRNV